MAACRTVVPCPGLREFAQLQIGIAVVNEKCLLIGRCDAGIAGLQLLQGEYINDGMKWFAFYIVAGLRSHYVVAVLRSYDSEAHAVHRTCL